MVEVRYFSGSKSKDSIPTKCSSGYDWKDTAIRDCQQHLETAFRQGHGGPKGSHTKCGVKG